MGKETDIQWADSTLNLQMGCDGCELWTPKKRSCYAGQLTERYAGLKGWPAAFDQPKLFPERLTKALRWPDLTGTKRPDKPWLDGLPRVVFLDDMGDTFTESLPLDWLAPHLPALASWPAIIMLLTKRVKRMAQFFSTRDVPDNFWLGASVTSPDNESRIRDLLKIDARVHWVSYEPAWDEVGWDWFVWPDCVSTKEVHDAEHDGGLWCDERGIDLLIIGGESGQGALPFEIRWLLDAMHTCAAANIPLFVKQLGAVPIINMPTNTAGMMVKEIAEKQEAIFHQWPIGTFFGNRTGEMEYNGRQVLLKDGHGGDWNEWPEQLRVRQFPRPVKP